VFWLFLFQVHQADLLSFLRSPPQTATTEADAERGERDQKPREARPENGKIPLGIVTPLVTAFFAVDKDRQCHAAQADHGRQKEEARDAGRVLYASLRCAPSTTTTHPAASTCPLRLLLARCQHVGPSPTRSIFLFCFAQFAFCFKNLGSRGVFLLAVVSCHISVVVEFLDEPMSIVAYPATSVPVYLFIGARRTARKSRTPKRLYDEVPFVAVPTRVHCLRGSIIRRIALARTEFGEDLRGVRHRQ
jgi:hypothetical protein